MKLNIINGSIVGTLFAEQWPKSGEGLNMLDLELSERASACCMTYSRPKVRNLYLKKLPGTEFGVAWCGGTQTNPIYQIDQFVTFFVPDIIVCFSPQCRH